MVDVGVCLSVLEGIRVLDFSHVYFGPYSTMMLGDLGADVVKVEPLWGEVAREYGEMFGGVSSVFHYLDRNKRGVTLNLKDRKGVEVALRLAEVSDIVVENFSRGAMDRLGLGYEDIRKVRPDIIYASLSGFGLDGPYSMRPSFASIASSMSGWYRLSGDIVDPRGPPIRPAEWHGDLDPALFATTGILAALVHRERTGEGQLVDVSQFDCMIAQNGIPITRYMFSGKHPWEQGSGGSDPRLMGMFRALDGWVFIHTSPRMKDRLMRGMGVETLEATEELERWVSERTCADIVETLVAVGVPSAPINSLEDVVNDPHVKFREVLQSVEHPEAGEVISPIYPVKFSKTPPSVRLPAPLLGQHNDEVLSELGYSKSDIAEMRKNKIIT